MKKQLIAVVAMSAVAVLASCTKTEIQTVQGPELAFSALNQKGTSTKAEVYGPITGTTYDVNEHFGVYAFYKDQDGNWANDAFMNKLEIQLDATDNKWRNADKKYYWPTKGSLDFVAFSPFEFGAGNVSATKDNGIAFEAFTADTDNDKQIDLMVCDVIKNKTNQSEPVKVAFKHILSQLIFKVVAKSDLSDSNIASITVNNFTVLTLNTVADYAQTDATVANGSWSNLDTEADYEVSATDVTVAIDASAASTLGNPIIVIPQDQKDAEVFQIEYTIVYTNGTEETITKKVAPSVAWVKGCVYTYTIKIGFNEITFSPEVSEDWIPVAGDIYEI